MNTPHRQPLTTNERKLIDSVSHLENAESELYDYLRIAQRDGRVSLANYIQLAISTLRP